ncbi:MAG: heavy-metal-associated domain-containing protein [Anaerolineae bacterium]
MSTQNVTLSVKGMHCSSCVKRIERALGTTKGISSVKVDLIGGKALVHYEPELVTDLAIKEVVRQLGFTVAT